MAGGLASFIAPTWYAFSLNSESADAAAHGYQRCMNAALQSGSGITEEGCWHLWMTGGPAVSLDDWSILISFAAIGCLVLYGLIRAAVWVAKWVWRGRESDKSTA